MKNIQIGFILLILFCLLRPLTFIQTNIEIEGLNVFELFAIIISYLLLFGVAINIRKMKIDLISFAILWFCLHSFMSLLWGSQLRIIAQVTLPFVLFFAARLMIRKPEEISFLVTIIIIAFCALLFGSLYQIIKGTSIIMTESITGIERHSGVFARLKPFAFAMFFFSVFYYLKIFVFKLKINQVKWILFLLLGVSFFCIFKTFARSAYIGLILFWILSLWGYKKKYFYLLLIFSVIFGVIYITPLEQIFIKTQKFDLNIASSGRIFIWKHNISYFLESSLDKKLFGHGLGVVSRGIIGMPNEIWSSHNDYLHVLMSLGSLGFLLYLFIFVVLLKDVYMSSLDKKIKFMYYGIIFSISFMNFTSGVILYQVGISQQFWLVIGFFYFLRDYNFILSNDNSILEKD